MKDYRMTTTKPAHRSDCAVHNEPAHLAGLCDCGLAEQISGKAERDERMDALRPPRRPHP